MKTNIAQNNRRYFFLLIILYSLVSYFITSYSSVINPYSGDNSNDSWIFRYMGMLIDKGGVPYRDAFEQKGPYLFVIEYIGLLINRDYGIWILEWISMTIFLLLLYKLCRLFISKSGSILCSIASITGLSTFFSGNMSEEFALPFIAFSIYIFTLYYVFHKFNNIFIGLCGLCCGCVFMLRPNMTALWVTMCIGVIIEFIKENKSFPIKFTLIFTIGFIISTLPYLIWFSLRDALSPFISQYFLFNYQYTSEKYTLLGQIRLMKEYFLAGGQFLPLIILIITSVKDKNLRLYNTLFIIYILLNGFLCSISLRGYAHYAMPLITCNTYPIALCYSLISKRQYKTTFFSKNMILNSVMFFLSLPLIVFMASNIITLSKALKSNIKSDDEFLLDEINEYTETNDDILILGNGARLYYESNRLSSSNYFIQVPIYAVNSSLKADIKKDINTTLPKVIIYCFSDNDPIYGDLFDHLDKYQLVDKFNHLYVLKE